MARLALFAAFACALCLVQCTQAAKFQEVVDVINARRATLSKHPFFAFLANETISPQRRLQFMPYWTYYAMGFADLLDSWVHFDSPKNELEERINMFAVEDNWHYNFFLKDLEEVLGYTMERFGSFSAVARHLWGDDSRAIRQFCYEWATAARNEDPMVVLATFEVAEAGLADFFSVAYEHLYLSDSGLKSLVYLGHTHIDLEMHHQTVTNWYEEEEEEEGGMKALELYDITEEQKKICVDVVNTLMDR